MSAKQPSVLIVEDEVLLALEAEALLEEAGFRVVGHALQSEEALALAQHAQPDLAVVDVQLLDGATGLEVARQLAATIGTLVIFATGNVRRVPEDFSWAVGVIEKPYSDTGFKAAMHFVRERFLDGSLRGRPPAGFRLARSCGHHAPGSLNALM